MSNSTSVPQPRVSVVLAVRNGLPYVQSAIDSILHQEFGAFELIIINDGSTDATRQILDAQTDLRIRAFHREPAGLPASLNFGISQARAELIARQDADDLSEPERLRRLVAVLNARPKAVLAHSACHFDEESGVAPGPSRVPRSRALLALKLCRHSPLVHGSVLFKKSVFLAVGGYNETYLQAQDFDLWGRMIAAGPFAYCPMKLYRLRLHKQSVSATKAAAQKQFRDEIAQENCRRMFRTSPDRVQAIFQFLEQPAAAQTARSWIGFAIRDLPRLRYQSAEVYLWAAIQALRSLRRRKAAPSPETTSRTQPHA